MDSAKDQPAVMPSSAKATKLRYPLRSAGKAKDGEPPAALAAGTPASMRLRNSSAVSRSVSVLDLAGKDKSTPKPPRRLSIPSKPAAASPHSSRLGNITPISEHRVKKADAQGEIRTPASDLSKTSNRKKFDMLSSVSYWLSQIKLSESAFKHSVSLGFFKLAQESGCEPLQRVRDELKSYAARHNILQLGEPARELLRSYDVLEEVEAQISQDNSHCQEEGAKSPEESSISPAARPGSQKPKSTKAEALGTADTTKKDSSSQRKVPTGNRAFYGRNSANSRSFRDGNGNAHKKAQNPRSTESNKVKGNPKITTKKPASETVDPPSGEDLPHENKENIVEDQLDVESNSTVELIQTN